MSQTMARRYYDLTDKEFYESEEWREISADIMERDEFRCQVCGITENLTVHHIVPRKYKHLVSFDIDAEFNLLTMCWPHHKMADHKIDPISGSEL